MTLGQISEKGNGFFSSPKNAQTDSGARSMGTGVFFSGVKRSKHKTITAI